MEDDSMKRRDFVAVLGTAAAVPVFGSLAAGGIEQQGQNAPSFNLSDEEWRARLTEQQYDVLRKEGTERPGTSPLNGEKRPGTYVCAGCGQPLFTSDTKYESGTGWPSFYAPIDGALGTKTDFKLVWPRTEYHCARCGGHQGHVFKDGPEPTGLRYCNNGVALKFVPADQNP
jgi:peptide-methionine (R)-S-oxide reductase